MKTSFEIKGQCECCGYESQGFVSSHNCAFPIVLCPSCGEEFENFDEAYVVDDLNEEEGVTPEYNRVIYITKPNVLAN